MRIGLVTESYDRYGGGLEQWTAQFVERLDARGHEVHVVAREFLTATPAFPHPLPHAQSRTGFAMAAEKTLRSLALDIVHDTGAGWYCDVLQPHFGSRRATIAQKLDFVPRWLRPIKRAMIRTLPRYHQFERLATRQYTHDGRLVLALSRRVADDLQRYDGVPLEQIRIVPNGIDIERFTPANVALHRKSLRHKLGLPDNTLVALIVAHNFRLKGVSTAIKAVGRLAAEGQAVHLIVVGGRRFRSYERLASRHESPVTFVGSVRETAPYYACADVYVHPTHYDACSLVVLEAMASGLPVITTHANGAGELMQDGRQGYLLSDPADDQRLAYAMHRMLDPVRRQNMGRSARRLMLEHTLQRNCNEIEALYQEIVDRRNADKHRRVRFNAPSMPQRIVMPDVVRDPARP